MLAIVVLRFAANLGFLFAELPLLERFSAARRAGFAAVELHGPESADARQIAAAATDAGVEIVLCNAPVGDLLTGGLGLSGVPGRRREFQDAIRWVAEFAQAIGCPSVNVGPSRLTRAAEREANLAALVDNLVFAGDRLATCGIAALLEPVNPFDFGDVLLCNVADAVAAIRASGHPNVHLQFDLYHVARMSGDWSVVLQANFADTHHVQFADVPGRGPPGSGGIDFAACFATLERLGYAGWIGAEYRPAGETARTLAWLERYAPAHGRPVQTASAPERSA